MSCVVVIHCALFVYMGNRRIEKLFFGCTFFIWLGYFPNCEVNIFSIAGDMCFRDIRIKSLPGLISVNKTHELNPLHTFLFCKNTFYKNIQVLTGA